ncbi:uncharacterized protein LOC143007985 [Genypterus blacodes]|uniref:uncharacterized protein LOC143007985 n=1 Tax=Genypterus blacodes TaxID=154954 RepID=UPI003F75F7D4
MGGPARWPLLIMTGTGGEMGKLEQPCDYFTFEESSRMDSTHDRTLQKMHRHIYVLNQSQSQLEWLNDDLRCRLSVADDEVEHLRFKNSKHKEKLETTSTYVHQTEIELCEIRTVLDKEQDMNKQREKLIQECESINCSLKQENEKLSDKLHMVQMQMEQDKLTLHSMETTLQNLQSEMERIQLELLDKEKVICQKNLVLKQLEESSEECLNLLTDLRLKNQELREMLKERHEETLCADIMRGMDGSSGQPLTLAEEIELLTASDEEEMIEEHKPESPPADCDTERCETWRQEWIPLRAKLLLLCFFILHTVLVAMAVFSCVGSWGFVSIGTLWRKVGTLIHPYCSIDYIGLPPV